MKFRKIAIVFLVIPLLAFTAHKFYVSVTTVAYSEKDDALQITSRLFIDDLEAVLLERYGIQANLATANEHEQLDTYLEKYLNTKLHFEIDGVAKTFEVIGRTYEDDVCIFYLEIAAINLPSVQSVQIENELLTDLFDEQQNIVHFKINGTKKSFVLLKSNTKGMLKL